MAKRSLTQFAAEQPKKIRCRTCGLPEAVRKEATEGRASGLTFLVISDWLLKEHAISVAESSLRKHFTAGHK